MIWPWTRADGKEVWGYRRHYEFAPDELAPGIHVLTGRWMIVDYPCAWDPDDGVCTSAEYLENPRYAFDLEQGTYDFTSAPRTPTLTVVHP